jgi:tetratricopeptide (TPR) repeat protein
MGQKALIDGDFKAAVSNLEKALAKDSTDVNTLYMLGYSYYLSARYKESVNTFNKVISFKPGDNSAYYYRGVALAKAGDNDNAIADFTHLIKIGSSLRNKSLQKRGNIYLDLSDFDKAFADYDLAIEGDPKDFFSFYVRGAIKTERKVFDKNKDTTYSRYEYTENGKFYYFRYLQNSEHNVCLQIHF